LTLVVDASVAVKWFAPEPLAEAAAELRRESGLVAPDFMLVEVANVFWKRMRRGDADLAGSQADLSLLQAGIPELVETSFLLEEALELAEQLDHPVYDCLYLALALSEGTAVVTADRRLHQCVIESEYAGYTRMLSDLPAHGGG
jgi:predicted nucleic acid-binding protein